MSFTNVTIQQLQSCRISQPTKVTTENLITSGEQKCSSLAYYSALLNFLLLALLSSLFYVTINSLSLECVEHRTLLRSTLLTRKTSVSGDTDKHVTQTYEGCFFFL